jgi:hypothetical protein
MIFNVELSIPPNLQLELRTLFRVTENVDLGDTMWRTSE